MSESTTGVQEAKAEAPPRPPQAEEDEVVVSHLDLRFRDEIASHPGGENIRRCFACGTCAAGCPVTDVDSRYNCRRIIRQILFGLREEVLSSPLIWMCLVCYRCYVRCPQKVNFTDIMRVLRYLAVKENRVSADTFERIAELDRFSQAVRRDLINGLFEKKGLSLDELEARVSQALKQGTA
ncbi:MAG: hypothetical protein FJ291_20990 [Planctomycetes bacterium]|nr:hypothetical protein [Planctomycetota bacterium]